MSLAQIKLSSEHQKGETRRLPSSLEMFTEREEMRKMKEDLCTLCFIHTSEMIDQDQRHKAETNQQRAVMTLQADFHKEEMLKQVACHEAVNKRKEAEHKEEIRNQVSRRIEAINLMEAVHRVENQKRDEQHKKETRQQDLLQTEEMLKLADWHRDDVNWLRGQQKAAMLNQASLHEAEIKRCKEEIKRLEDKLENHRHHRNPYFLTIVGSTLTLVGSVLTLVASILPLVASPRSTEK